MKLQDKDLFYQRLSELELKFKERDYDFNISHSSNKEKPWHLKLLLNNNNSHSCGTENLSMLYHISEFILENKEINRFFGIHKRGIMNIKGYSPLLDWSSITNNISISNHMWNQTDIYSEIMKNVKSSYDNTDSNSIVTVFNKYEINIFKSGKRSRKKVIPFYLRS